MTKECERAVYFGKSKQSGVPSEMIGGSVDAPGETDPKAGLRTLLTPARLGVIKNRALTSKSVFVNLDLT